MANYFDLLNQHGGEVINSDNDVEELLSDSPSEGTIDAANLIFSPHANEVAKARRIVEAYEEATREGKGVTTLDGRLVEILHRDVALRTLHLARTIAEKDRRMRSEAKSFYNDHVAPARYK